MTIKNIVEGYNNVLIQDPQEMNEYHQKRLYPYFQNMNTISNMQEEYPDAKEGIQTLAFQTENENLMYVAKQHTLNSKTKSAIYKYDIQTGNLYKLGEMDENNKFSTGLIGSNLFPYDLNELQESL